MAKQHLCFLMLLVYTDPSNLTPHSMAMREENLAGESFSGKLSSGDPLNDKKRAELMEEQVLGMLERQETKNMMPHTEEERGGLHYYCKTCKYMGPVTLDVEQEKLSSLTCDNGECGAAYDQLSVGTKGSIISHYKVKTLVGDE